MLLHLAETNEVAEDGGGVLTVLKLVLPLVQVRFKRLQLGQLLGDIRSFLLCLLPVGLRFTDGAAALRPILEHVEADAILHYKIR